jgi:hypothetical protein
MKTKSLLLGASVLLVVAGLWFGRRAWQAHHKLVTLNVRNAALGDVLRKIEKQTWEKIRVEKSLDARITLHVKDKPLKYVLDRVGEQAGASWSRLYAVYSSPQALQSLDFALQSEAKLESSGWTKIAPNPDANDEPEAGDARPFFRAGPPPDQRDPNSSPPPEARGRIMFRRSPAGDVMIAENANGETQMWSPEELLLESKLKQRLGLNEDLAPTAEAAEDTARKVSGKWTTYLAFRKSIMGIGFVPPSPGRSEHSPLRRNPNERFAGLTPEQRVLRARQQLQFTKN